MKWRCYNRYLWFEIERCPFPRTPQPFGHRASALRASIFGPLGLKLSPQTQKTKFAHGRWEICRTNQNTAATALAGYSSLFAYVRIENLRTKVLIFCVRVIHHAVRT